MGTICLYRYLVSNYIFLKLQVKDLNTDNTSGGVTAFDPLVVQKRITALTFEPAAFDPEVGFEVSTRHRWRQVHGDGDDEQDHREKYSVRAVPRKPTTHAPSRY